MVLNCEAFLWVSVLKLVAHVDSKRFVMKIGFHAARTGVSFIVKQTDRSVSLIFQQKLFLSVYVNTDLCNNDYNGSPFLCTSTYYHSIIACVNFMVIF
jgi:hypothetical protein